ncbi:sugar transferase, partial [Thermus islandicus]|uniref:sugar transferase n=1 Tax=Thermus islandicus TaxID=540988 RepID=UPI0003B3E527
MEVLEVALPAHPSLGKARSPWPLFLAPFPALLALLLLFPLLPRGGETWLLLALTAAAHLFAFFLTERMARYHGQEALSLAAFNLLLFTLFLLAVLAMGRLYYSRSYLLLATLFAFLLLLLYLKRTPPLRLALLRGGVSERLVGLFPHRAFPLGSLDRVEGVVVDPRQVTPQALPLLVRAALEGLPVLHAGKVYEVLTGRVLLEESEGVLAVAEMDPGLYRHLKRPLEVLFILLLSPLFLLIESFIALAVYLDLGRPVFFAQERVGLGGKPFKAYKFRTMRGWPREGAYAGEEAERITPLGRFLRRYRLDELPQLWNVLKGEMSLVGPRPEQRVLAEAYAREIPLYALRHTVRPGLTGWAQVHQGYAEGKEETLVKLSY